MKKTLFSLFTALTFNALLLAQPALQMNVVPNIGDVVTFYEADTLIQPGNAGANQLWDFSGLTPLAGTTPLQYYYLAPANTPPAYAANFPAANFVIKVDSDTAIYSYWNKSNTEFANLGVQSEAYLQLYPNTDIQLKPLSYNGSFQDNFTNSTDAGTGFIFYGSGERNIKYDAYGTLKTPAGTFTNAMRIKGESSQVDSVDIGVGQLLNYTNFTVYDWLVANEPGVLVSIIYTHLITETRFPGLDTIVEDFGTVKSVNYISNFAVSTFDRPDQLAGIELQMAGANPVIDELSVRITAAESRENLQLLLTDLGGRVIDAQILSLSAGDNAINLPVAQLAAGAYFLTLTDGKAASTLKWQKF